MGVKVPYWVVFGISLLILFFTILNPILPEAVGLLLAIAMFPLFKGLNWLERPNCGWRKINLPFTRRGINVPNCEYSIIFVELVIFIILLFFLLASTVASLSWITLIVIGLVTEIIMYVIYKSHLFNLNTGITALFIILLLIIILSGIGWVIAIIIASILSVLIVVPQLRIVPGTILVLLILIKLIMGVI